MVENQILGEAEIKKINRISALGFMFLIQFLNPPETFLFVFDFQWMVTSKFLILFIFLLYGLEYKLIWKYSRVISSWAGKNQ